MTSLPRPLLNPPHTTRLLALDSAAEPVFAGSGFETLVDAIPGLLMVCTADGRSAYINATWLEYTGCATPQALEACWHEIVHPDDRGELNSTATEACDPSGPFDVRLRLRNAQGAFVWHVLRMQPLAAAQTHPALWIGLATPMEQRPAGGGESSLELAPQLALQAMRESEHRFSQFASRSDDVFWIADPKAGKLLYVSPAFEQLWGHDCAALRGDPQLWNRSLIASSPVELPTPFFMPSAAAGDKEPVREYRIERADGTPLWVRDRRFHLHASGSEVTCIGGIAEDITERKVWDTGCEVVLALEREARREAEAQASAKDEFLAVVSHELRSPLNAIRGWAHVLRQTGELSHAQLRMLDAIDRNTLAQAQLVDDMLDTQRLLRGKVKLELSSTSLASLIEQAVDTFRPAAAAKQIQIGVSHAPEIDTIQADPERLRQALVNLLSNAVKFTLEQGHISVASRLYGGRIVISVADTGIGIEPALLPRIFDPFRQAADASTRRQSGLGLGLALARQLVELHGGSLRAASEGVGQGTTFTIELPHRVAGMPVLAPAPVRGDALAALRLDGCRIAIVDDDLEARQILELMLMRQQARCVAFSSVAASYAYFVSVTSQQRPHVLISDIAMPDEDGYSLVRRLRALERRRGDAPMSCIALTAFVTEKDRARALSSGFDAHLGKPVDPRQLLVTIKGLLQALPQGSSG